MATIIKTENLQVSDIPSITTEWDAISKFALSFDPMLELGTTDIYKLQFAKFDENSSIQELRLSLFLLQRWWNNRLKNIDEDGLKKIHDLLHILRKKVILLNSQKDEPD